MVIDTSALVAILQAEPLAAELRNAIAADSVRLISSMSVLEATCVLSSRRGAGAVLELELFFSEFHFQVVPFDRAQLAIAQRAFLLYGRGRHSAKLNFGDCASYALAQDQSEPLLFIGNDFPQTDVRVALTALPQRS